MLKNLPLYVLVIFFMSGIFLSIMPYPTFYSGTYNLSKTDIAKINFSSEKESYDLQNLPENSPACLKLDWQSVNALFDFQVPFKLIDIKSELVLNVCRIAGENHADIRPCEEKDRVLLSGLTENTTLPRPCLVQIKKGLWTSASLSTKIHTDIDNETHFCLYFDGSCAHSTGLKDCEHQKAIDYAQKHGQDILKKIAF